MQKTDPRHKSNEHDRNVALEDIDTVEDRSGARQKSATGYSAEAKKLDRSGDEDIDNEM